MKKQFLIEFEDSPNSLLESALYDLLQNLKGVRLKETRILLPDPEPKK